MRIRRRALFLLLLACAGCSSGSASGREDGDPGTRVLARTRLPVVRVACAEGDLALELGGSPAGSLADDFAAGRRWLHLRRPLGLSFLTEALLTGRAPWRAEGASVSLVRRVGGGGGRDVALVRLEGVTDRAQVEAIGDPGLAPRGLDALASQEMRILLGNGVDQLAGSGDPDRMEVVAWVDVVDGGNRPADWIGRLEEAHRARSEEPLDGFFVIAKRVRGDGSQAFFRAPLGLVALAGQARLVRQEEERFAFVWEGVWTGSMAPAPREARYPGSAPTMSVEFKEYRQAASTSGIWKTLLAPVSIPVDFGAALFDPEADEGLFDEVAERQRDRR